MLYPFTSASLPYLLLTTLTLSTLPVLSSPQMPRPPPDACSRRNDTLPACPYGGQCHPDQNYSCSTGCVNYQYTDSRFWCNIICGYKATTLQGEIAPNPMWCIQPAEKIALTCESNWACYRQFGTKAPDFRTRGPVCAPAYKVCTPGKPVDDSANSTSSCGAGSACVADPRPGLTKLALQGDVPPGICVPAQKTCAGKLWNECGDEEVCVRNPSCAGELGKDCTGLCVRLVGVEGSSTETTENPTKRSIITKQC